MRYTKYIATLFALIAISACTIADIDNQVTVGGGASNDQIQVMGRITRFADVDVSTRGVKNETEAKLTSMAMAIFPVVNNNTLGECIYYKYEGDQAELLFTVNRSELSISPNAPYAMYIFCNMPGLDDFDEETPSTVTLPALMAKAYEVSSLNIPNDGFPMMGSLGDTFSSNFERDGKTFILAPLGSDNKYTVPTVNGIPEQILNIPMKAMFAKVNFTIEVRPDQTIEGNYSPQFTLEGYTVNNVPSTVDFDNSTNSDNDVLDGSFNLPISGNTVASGANKINFTFYLPERHLTPTYQSHDGSKQNLTGYYNYPFPVVNGKYRDEDLDLRQRYKPELVGNKKATNVKISGRFRDHQAHYWDVDYTIYLGEDNYGDFNVRRNSEYHNYITIRGIQTSSDMSDNENAISIDHRVNVERTQPAIISLRRETLLDSHFEVRPLRVRKSEEDVTGINAVKVEVVNPGTTDWMRLERSFGDGTPAGSPNNESGQCIYINEDVNDAAYGKRRYFTYNLVKIPDNTTAGQYDHPLNNNTEVILPLTDATECCWIYIDECTEVGDAVRSGIVKVSYGKLEGTTFTPANNSSYPDVQYIINQRKLFQVTGTKTYNIEYQEEYLHNFDADDNFGQTEYEGMPWGLEGVQLSYDHEALYFKSKTGDWANGIVDYFTGEVPAYYDFYVKKHDESRMADPKQVTLHEYAGFEFCSEIITTVNGGQKDSNGNAYDTDTSNDINILQLNQQPKSAVEYCYNKNKRNNKGEVVWQNGTTYDQSQYNWYLPAIDEMEDIVMSTYGSNQNTYARFLDFQGQDYWSCQPAYIQNYAHMQWTFIIFPLDYWGAFYYDDIGNTDFDINNNTNRAHIGSARATRVTYNGTQYLSTASGTNGYYSYYDARSEVYQYSGTFNGVVIGTISREAGNFPRNERNRVRCVRKQ